MRPWAVFLDAGVRNLEPDFGSWATWIRICASKMIGENKLLCLPNAYPFISPLFCPFDCLHKLLTARRFIPLFVCQSIPLPLNLSICLLVCSSHCLSVHVFAIASVPFPSILPLHSSIALPANLSSFHSLFCFLFSLIVSMSVYSFSSLFPACFPFLPPHPSLLSLNEMC